MLVELLVYLLFMDDGHHHFLVEGGLSSESGVEMLKWLEAFLLHSVLSFFFECKKHDRHLVSWRSNFS